LREGDFACPVNGREEVELALGGLNLAAAARMVSEDDDDCLLLA